jgi:hypothetical protein
MKVCDAAHRRSTAPAQAHPATSGFRRFTLQARERGSQAVYLDTAHAPAHEHALGPTARYLLEKRPCRIIIETDGGGRVRSGAMAAGARSAKYPVTTP